jgi:hypothetical protein
VPELVPILVPYLPEAKRDGFFAEYLRPLVAAAAANPESGWKGAWRRADALAGLAQLPQSLVGAAVDIVEKHPPDEDQADALAVLMPRLPGERRAPILRRELARMRRIDDGPARLDALAALVPYLADDPRAALAEEVLAASPPLTTRDYRGELDAEFGAFERVGTLVPCLLPERTVAVLNHAFDTALTIEEPRSRAQALAAIVPVLPAAKIPEALSIVQSLGDDGYILLATRAEAARVLSTVPDDTLAELPEDFVDALRSIAPHLDDVQVVTALELTGNIYELNHLLRADAIGILASRLRGRALDMAMSLAANLEGLARVRAAAALIPLLPESQRPAALREAREVAGTLARDEERVQALAALAPLLADPQAAQAEALQAAKAITDDHRRARVLGDLLPHLGPASQLAAIDTMLRSCLRTRGTGAWSAADRKDNDRAFVLERIAASADTFASLGGPGTVAEITRAIQETTQWWP